jgi:hypothetical protein
MVQSALGSTAEALPPPAVGVPKGIRHTQQRGSGRLQFGQAIGRVEDAEADKEAAACMSINKESREKMWHKSKIVQPKNQDHTLNAAAKS